MHRQHRRTFRMMQPDKDDSMEDSETMFDWAEMGTPVSIVP